MPRAQVLQITSPPASVRQIVPRPSGVGEPHGRRGRDDRGSGPVPGSAPTAEHDDLEDRLRPALRAEPLLPDVDDVGAVDRRRSAPSRWPPWRPGAVPGRGPHVRSAAPVPPTVGAVGVAAQGDRADPAGVDWPRAPGRRRTNWTVRLLLEGDDQPGPVVDAEPCSAGVYPGPRRGGRTSGRTPTCRPGRASSGWPARSRVRCEAGRDRVRATPRSSVTSGCPSRVNRAAGERRGPCTISSGCRRRRGRGRRVASPRTRGEPSVRRAASGAPIRGRVRLIAAVPGSDRARRRRTTAGRPPPPTAISSVPP